MLQPLIAALGIQLPSGGDVVAAIQDYLRTYADQLADAASDGHPQRHHGRGGAGHGRLHLGRAWRWARCRCSAGFGASCRRSTYRDLTELELAIAVSFGGFVRGRLLIGAVYGTVDRRSRPSCSACRMRRSSASSPA